MIWSNVTGTLRKSKTRTGWGARPGAFRIVWLPKISVHVGGTPTDTPRVATTFTSMDESRSSRNSAK